jgi:hypothetical protein
MVLYTRWTERKPPGNVLMNYGNIEAHENTAGFKVHSRLSKSFG